MVSMKLRGFKSDKDRCNLEPPNNVEYSGSTMYPSSTFVIPKYGKIAAFSMMQLGTYILNLSLLSPSLGLRLTRFLMTDSWLWMGLSSNEEWLHDMYGLALYGHVRRKSLHSAITYADKLPVLWYERTLPLFFKVLSSGSPCILQSQMRICC